MQNKNIVVWFSCGAASSVAAKITIEKYGKKNNVLIVNNPILEEHSDNLRFLKDCEDWLGQKIIQATCKEYPNHSIVEVFNKKKYMSGVAGAPCTKYLKKQARYEFELNNKIDFHVLGFTYDEIKRHEKFTTFERSNVLPVLIENKILKNDCFDILKQNKIKLPEIYNLGFSNANCIGCVKSQSPTYWNLVKKNFPEIFDQRKEQSRSINCKLVKYKNKRIFLDELPENAKGGKIKTYECGIFCELPKIKFKKK